MSWPRMSKSTPMVTDESRPVQVARHVIVHGRRLKNAQRGNVYCGVFEKKKISCAVIRPLVRGCKGNGGWEQTDINAFSL